MSVPQLCENDHVVLIFETLTPTKFIERDAKRILKRNRCVIKTKQNGVQVNGLEDGCGSQKVDEQGESSMIRKHGCQATFAETSS